jgi:SAM-dependent methyltransferase
MTSPLSPAQTVAPAKGAFGFGRNWQRYIDTYLDADRERIAAESLRELVGDVEGHTFLDVGCGSGLFSLCAVRLGASEVTSLDVDPDAVAATSQLHARAGSPTHWRVLHRSILEDALASELAPADVVYSWGVLHHTGDMHTAIRHAAALVNPGGRFAIAIYNRVSGGAISSERWWQIKRAYNRAPRPIQLAMELGYGLYWSLVTLRAHRNPLRVAREYRRSRGMALWTDLVDWLGGYPYEFANVAEIRSFCEGECGLRMVNVLPVPGDGTGNNQFLFIRPAEG